ncbi:hypothetical protein EDF70_1209 [Neorhizobium sp. JUb45]|nr:hypothetical protein EDF70_1209 [Neorhizobium sp. JUb45]
MLCSQGRDLWFDYKLCLVNLQSVIPSEFSDEAASVGYEVNEMFAFQMPERFSKRWSGDF